MDIDYMILYRMLDKISYNILNVKAWHIYTWCAFMTSLAFIVLLSGQLTTDLYHATLLNIGTPIIGYIGIQYYKSKYIKQV